MRKYGKLNMNELPNLTLTDFGLFSLLNVYLILSNKFLILLSLIYSFLQVYYIVATFLKCPRKVGTCNIIKEDAIQDQIVSNFTEMSFQRNLCVNFVLNDEFAQIISSESTFCI